MSTLPPQIMRQLALIRYLLHQGVEQSRKPSPLFALALLSFQDAAELFLHLACEHHHQSIPKKTEFLEYWKVLQPVGQVTHQPAMDRLNRARVNFKHAGNLPNEQDMESHRAAVIDLFEVNCPTLFGVRFEDISMLEVVSCAPARDHLRNAEQHWKDGKKSEAAGELARAFKDLTSDYASRKSEYNHFNPFSFDRSLPTFRPKSKDRELDQFIDGATKSIGLLSDAVRVLALGVDYRRHVYFKRLVPVIHSTVGGGEVVHQVREQELSDEEYGFCRDFVIECAVKLQDFDFTVPPARIPGVGVL